MLPISKAQCGGVLSVWLEKQSSPDVVKEIVKESGYNDSPFFGAEKKRIKVVGEVMIVETAIAIYAVNQVLKFDYAKQVIDYFLLAAKTPIFGIIEKRDPTFQERYPSRMSDYFKAMAGKQPVLGLSFSFMENLGLNPMNNLEGQLRLCERFSGYVSNTIDVVQRFEFVD